MAELVSKDSIQLLSTTQVNISDDQNELDLVEEETKSPLKRKTIIRVKDINEYGDQKSSQDVALLDVINEKDRVSYPEERIIAYASEFLLEGANIQCTDVFGNTPLHQAAWNGFPDLTKELLQRGADVHALNCDCQTPMEIAITKGVELGDERSEDYSRVAALVIREMDSASVRKMFLASQTETCKLNFREVLSRPEMQEATTAILDTLIEKVPQSRTARKVHYTLLEANENGDILSGSQRESNFKYIVDTDNKDVLVHPAVLLLIQSKWKRFAKNKLIINFIYWIITMILLSLALLLAAKSEDSPTIYNDPVDYFRAICEGLILLMITIAAVRNIMLLFKMKIKFFKEYKFFIFSYINILTAVLLYIYIILHVVQAIYSVDTHYRWAVAAIAYVLYTLMGIRFLLIMRSISNYFLILVKILKHDIIPFLVVFGTILLAATVGLFLGQRMEKICAHPSNNTLNNMCIYSKVNHHNRTLLDYAFYGIRMMIEGERIIEDEQLISFVNATYLIFMFFVVVVLQSLLIAQMTDTFATVQVDAARILILYRARTIINIEETTSSYAKKQPWLNKISRVKFSILSEEVWTNPDTLLVKVKLPESVQNAKTLCKLEKLMTTQRELVEELRDSMMSEQRRLITILKSLTGADPE